MAMDNPKKRLKMIIKLVSTPVPKEQDKQLHPDGYKARRTHQGKGANTPSKHGGTSQK